MDDYRTALEAAGAKVAAFESFGSYQGDWWARVEYEGATGWVHGWYGSCSGCDAFEAEFGWPEDKCQEHRWKDSTTECAACNDAKARYQEKLISFGRSYLDPLMTQAEAEADAEKNLSWDSDAQTMLTWIQANALEAK